jgi:hypothetical protein
VEDEADGGTTTVVITVLSVEDVAADEADAGSPTAVVVVVEAASDDEVTVGTPIVVVVVVSVVDTPATPEDGGVPVRKDRLDEMERWMILSVAELVGRGTGMMSVSDELGKTSIVVVVVVAAEADEEVSIGTVIVVVVNGVDEAEMTTAAELEGRGAGTTIVCVAEDADSEADTEFVWALDGSTEISAALEDDADWTIDHALAELLGIGSGMTTVTTGCDDEPDMLEDVETGAGKTTDVCGVDAAEELSTGGTITLLDIGSCEDAVNDADVETGGIG